MFSNKSDLSKRADKTKCTTIKRKASGSSVTSKTVYQSAASEKVISQDDGIALKRAYAYDNYGNITAEEVISRLNSALKMKKKYSYLNSSSNMTGNALFTEWDENGNAIKYEYQTYGFLSDVITPVDSQDISYRYSNGPDYGAGDGVLGSIYARESANVEQTSNDLYYNVGYLTRVSHGGTTYNFVYDGFGRITKIAVDNTAIIQTIYTDNGIDIDGVSEATSKVVTSYSRSGLLVNLLCGMSKCGRAIVTPAYDENRPYNDVYVSYYNCFGELKKVRHAFGRDPKGEFNAEDDYIAIQDNGDIITRETKGARYEYRYDSITDRPLKSSEYENDKLKIKCENKEPDKFGRDIGIKITLDNGAEMEYTYAYKSDYEDSISGVTLPSGKKIAMEADEFGRIKSRTLNISSAMTNRYEYMASEGYSGYTTPLVSKETIKVGSSTDIYNYSYDKNNNITAIRDGNNRLIASYEYDGLNRLIRENIADGNTTVYQYDSGGNIRLCKQVSFDNGYGCTIDYILENVAGGEHEYKYTFINRDLLSSYNGNELLVYDNCGQPVMWFKHGADKSSLKYILQWSDLHLTAITDIDTQKMYYYKYNDQGIRTEKVVDGVTHKYYLQGEQIIAEKIGDKYLKFYYDSTGACGFNYNGTDYYYQKNIFGDILKIYDGTGKVYGEYSYTAWGKSSIKTNVNGIGEINPFRYRGYYYDEEISLYYLNARYYDPEIGRFISADRIEYLSPESINGLNLYTYCGNNPVMYIMRGVSSGSGGSISSSVLVGNGSGVGSQNSAPEWLKIGVGAIPDMVIGAQYLLAKGIHKQFVYSTATRYYMPMLGDTWRWFGKSGSALKDFGGLAGASFKQILTGNARAGFGAIAKSLGKTAFLTGLVNFGFNLYENNWQIDGAMLLDTAIDTGIGLGAYGLAAGTMSLATVGLAMAGLAIPGGAVVVGIIALSIFFDWLIREITGYKN